MKDKDLNILENNKVWILLFVCLTIFIIILINVLNSNVKGFDISVYSQLSYLRFDFTTIFFKIITRFADEESLIMIAIIGLIFIKKRRIGLSIAVNLAVSGFANHILKEIVQRPRPPIEIRMVQEESFSFPSGHSMTSLTFYGLIIYFVLKNVKNKELNKFILISLSLLIFLIGLSRIYLGVHYASDVLAGFFIGIVYLILYIKFVLKIFKI